MFQNLIPHFYVSSLLEVDLQILTKRKIKGIICDMDNTLVSWEKDTVEAPVLAWFQEVKEREFLACLVSNGLPLRVAAISQILDVPYVARAIKPRREPFQRAMKILNLLPEEIAVIGDQIFTDIWGGNRMGMMTILVEPLSRRELPNTRLVRLLERQIKKRLPRDKKGMDGHPRRFLNYGTGRFYSYGQGRITADC